MTRRGLHAVAELVLAGPQHRASGTIRLRVCPGGFCTVAAPDLRVDGVHLVTQDGRRLAVGGRPIGDVAAEAGVAAGAPEGLYHDQTGVSLDETLTLDVDAAAALAEAFAIGDAALRLFAPDAEPVLWPEHFDVGIRVDEVNYGLSPGDGFIDEPYAYVGLDPVPDDAFWDAPFGAARPVRTLRGADGVLAFYRDARERSAASRSAE